MSIGTMEERDRRASEAMDRYADGDAAAFPALYDALAPRLFGYLLRLTHSNRALAEDLLQQTFLRIHDARGRFAAGSSVAPWAYAIARRLFLDTVRKGRRQDHSAEAKERLARRPSAEPAPDANLDAEQAAATLEAELARLPPNQREAFLLVREEGLSMAEAALALGTTVTAVKLRASRAYRALRAALEAEGATLLEDG